MQRIVICTEVAGFIPERSLMHGLFKAHPEAFEGPWEPENFGLTAESSDEDVSAVLCFGLLHNGELFLYRATEKDARTLPWLVAEVERRQGRNCTWRGGCAKVVAVPDEVEWLLYEADDGSESIHEAHRIWA
jgi:hypothetical protein